MYIKKETVAKLLGVCNETVMRYYRSGKLKGKKFGNRTSPVKFLQKDVVEFINNSKNE